MEYIKSCQFKIYVLQCNHIQWQRIVVNTWNVVNMSMMFYNASSLKMTLCWERSKVTIWLQCLWGVVVPFALIHTLSVVPCAHPHILPRSHRGSRRLRGQHPSRQNVLRRDHHHVPLRSPRVSQQNVLRKSQYPSRQIVLRGGLHHVFRRSYRGNHRLVFRRDNHHVTRRSHRGSHRLVLRRDLYLSLGRPVLPCKVSLQLSLNIRSIRMRRT